ncbi:hypothetical protein BDV34DRAFT_185413 [Aspergillus parasiticus]|uniref:Uncharacterized protein n=2 Tax=Aspergillus subgen. Circumdati TaxID=2720871 RepID=A0A5N6E150_ASPPA|nr:hypothetical protein BDV34DRAFT_185413 [Aspergillus parasiticus]KAB8223728.1 hypothetical protein BDV33DRAFT_167012 [Aspergillus novoparasiticus]
MRTRTCCWECHHSNFIRSEFILANSLVISFVVDVRACLYTTLLLCCGVFTRSSSEGILIL